MQGFVDLTHPLPIRQGGTVPIVFRLRDEYGYIQPFNTPTVSIRDPVGNQLVLDAAMTYNPATNEGLYYHQVGSDAREGTYLVECKGTFLTVVGTRTFAANAKFPVSRLGD